MHAYWFRSNLKVSCLFLCMICIFYYTKDWKLTYSVDLSILFQHFVYRFLPYSFLCYCAFPMYSFLWFFSFIISLFVGLFLFIFLTTFMKASLFRLQREINLSIAIKWQSYNFNRIALPIIIHIVCIFFLSDLLNFILLLWKHSLRVTCL